MLFAWKDRLPNSTLQGKLAGLDSVKRDPVGAVYAWTTARWFGVLLRYHDHDVGLVQAPLACLRFCGMFL